MQTIGRLFLRVSLLAGLVAGAAIAAGSGCGLISAESDCNAACSLYNDCGLLKGGSCGGYCAALVPGAAVAGCGDALDKQDTCAKTYADCKTATEKCAADIAAFAVCMTAFCKKSPSATGCSVLAMQAGDGGA